MARQRARCRKCGGTVEYDPDGSATIQCRECGVSLRVPGSQSSLVGKTLGEYDLHALLGRGGMGVVYRARQPKLDRYVALKVLPRSLSEDAKFVARFEREGRAAAAVTHPNIVQIYDVGQADGRRYIAMELVDGESLDATLKREGKLDPQRALDLMRQVTAALAVAHDANIVHRDIKPSNILVGADGVPKVVDFGLAKRPDEDVSVTVTGTALGTPRYMPPEAARGKRLEPRSDLYSLGATFYHLIAGAPVFGGESTAELIVQHATERPTPLARAAPGLDRRFARIIDKLLRKNPDARCADARELLKELTALGTLGQGGGSERSAPSRPRRGARTGGRTPRRPAARSAPSRQDVRKSRLPLILGGVGAAVVLVVALMAVLGARREEKPQARTAPPTATTPTPESAPAPPSEEKPQPPPEEPTPPPAKPDPTEAEARTLLDSIRRTARDGTWLSAETYLARLDRDFAKSRLYADERQAIDELRAQIETALARKPEPPKPEPPKPEPPKPEPEPQPEQQAGEWRDLFDGKTLNGWRVLDDKGYEKHGEVTVRDGRIILEKGEAATGIVWTGESPRDGYELVIEAARAKSGGTFCSVVFHVGETQGFVGCGFRTPAGTAVAMFLGGAQHTNFVPYLFEDGRDYRLGIRVFEQKVQISLEGKTVLGPLGVPSTTQPKALPAAETTRPLIRADRGTCWIRSIRIRSLKPEPAAATGPIEPDETGDVLLRAAVATVHPAAAGKGTLRYDRDSDCIAGWSHGDDAVSWTFAVRKPGKYTPYLAYAAGEREKGGRYSFELRAEGSKTAPKPLTANVDDTGGLSTFSDKRGAAMYGFPGPGVLVLTIRPAELRAGSEFMRLRSVTFRFEQPASPKPTPPETGTHPWPLYTQWPFDSTEAKRRQEETAKALGVPVERDVDLGDGVTMRMVLVPAGEFMMGDARPPGEVCRLWPGGASKLKEHVAAHPLHRVRITRPFYMGACEVTQAQFTHITGKNPTKSGKGPNRPVGSVWYRDMAAFLSRLPKANGMTFRLPTEAEWEYACRAGSAGDYCYGNDEKDFGDYGSLHPGEVGQKKPNAWGLYDMHGNAEEGCEDFYASDYYSRSPVQDPRGASSGGRLKSRVVRGGIQHPAEARCAWRDDWSQGLSGDHMGFRCAATIRGTEKHAERPIKHTARSRLPMPTLPTDTKPLRRLPSKVYRTWPFDDAEAVRRQQETARALGLPVTRELDLGDGKTMTFVLIPAGEFVMGSRKHEDAQPLHRVKITRPFYLGQCEVTSEQYGHVMKLGYRARNKSRRCAARMLLWDHAMGFMLALPETKGARFRLPTEAEWEYACRAGSAGDFCFGDDEARLGEYASMAPSDANWAVATKRPNAWGLYDMHGNVPEWCLDEYAKDAYRASPAADPKGPSTGKSYSSHVLRGGSGGNPRGAQSGARGKGSLGAGGFRCVWVVE